ncbi:alpha/beta hydrolase [Nocardioides ultimimeridianus]
MSRPDGPFDYYADLYGGGSNVTASSIRRLVDDPSRDSATIALLAEDLDHDGTVTASLVEGQIRSEVAKGPAVVAGHARRLGINGTYAVGLVNLLATHVHTFDGVVASLNDRYRRTMHACRVVAGVATPTADDLLTAPVLAAGYVSPPAQPAGGNAWQQLYTAPAPTFDAAAVGTAVRGDLQGEYRHARRLLDGGVADVATKFGQGPTHANLRLLVDLGAIPLPTAERWPWLHLTDAERRKALLALVASGAVPDPATLPAGSVQSWLKAHPEIADYLSLFVPPRIPTDGKPTDVADWWRGLGVLGQLAAAAHTPSLVGNLDGVQGWGRDLANRTLLDQYVAQIRSTIPYGKDSGFTDEQLRSIAAIRDDLAKGNRQLLGLDLFSGERSHAIVAIGNVDTAQHVGVFTPGLTSNVPDSLNGYDNDMSNLAHQANAMITRNGGHGSVATVVYLGYDAPQLDLSLLDLGAFGGQADSVVAPDLAIRGGDSLASFYQGLDASRSDGVHLTALGHSYGSTTTGYALQHAATGVDDAVLFGSPGPGTGNRGDLHVPNLYVIENDNDLVADGGIFGGDPSFMDGVTHLQSHAASHDGASYLGTTGHTSYLDNGSTAQHNMAAVLTGIHGELITGQDLDGGDLLTAPNPGDLLAAGEATGGDIKDGFEAWGADLVHGLESFGRPPGY